MIEPWLRIHRGSFELLLNMNYYIPGLKVASNDIIKTFALHSPLKCFHDYLDMLIYFHLLLVYFNALLVPQSLTLKKQAL